MPESIVQPAFQLYSPLQSENEQIRFVTIEPGEDESSEIRCSLQTTELANSPTYYALSYVWGDQNATRSITLSGHIIHITLNLYQALKRLRGRPETSHLWIDAICINQSSREEKASQIPLMGRIYSRAKQVLMWVGDEDDRAGPAMAFIRKWSEGITAARNLDPDNFWPNALDLSIDHIGDPFNEQEVQAFGSLLARPYWRRMWIIQEIVLSADPILVCGREEVPFEQFWMTHYLLSEIIDLNKHGKVDVETFALVDKYVSGMGSPTNATLATIRWLITSRQDMLSRNEEFRPDIFILASRTRDAASSDLRDKIYGFFGLLPSYSLPMKPDYGIDAAEVYTRFTLKLITSSLKIICLAGIGVSKKGSALKLPSWVPDFSMGPANSSLAATDAANDQTFRASMERDDYCSLHLPVGSSRLATEGFICDEIVELYTRDPEVDSGYHWLWTLFETVKAHCPSIHPSGIPLRQAFFRNLMRDASGFGHGRPDFINPDAEALFFSHADAFMVIMRRIALQKMALTGIFESLAAHRGHPVDVSLEMDVNQLLDLDRVHQSGRIDFETLYWACNSSVTSDPDLRNILLGAFIGDSDASNRLAWPLSEYGRGVNTHGSLDFAAIVVMIRSFIMTKQGYMGRGPYHVESGDRICVLFGCPVPLVIRRRGSNYILVGEAYVYGMMHGEMMDMFERGEFSREMLVFE